MEENTLRTHCCSVLRLTVTSHQGGISTHLRRFFCVPGQRSYRIPRRLLVNKETSSTGIFLGPCYCSRRTSPLHKQQCTTWTGAKQYLTTWPVLALCVFNLFFFLITSLQYLFPLNRTFKDCMCQCALCPFQPTVLSLFQSVCSNSKPV